MLGRTLARGGWGTTWVVSLCMIVTLNPTFAIGVGNNMTLSMALNQGMTAHIDITANADAEISAERSKMSAPNATANIMTVGDNIAKKHSFAPHRRALQGDECVAGSQDHDSNPATPCEPCPAGTYASMHVLEDRTVMPEEPCTAAGGYWAAGGRTCWVRSNPLSETLSACTGVCASVGMVDQPMPVWIDALYGPGNSEPENDAGYKTALCETLCPGYGIRDPSTGVSWAQEWAQMTPACEMYTSTNRRCFLEDREWVSGSVSGSGWSVDDNWRANRNPVTPFARLCPCEKGVWECMDCPAGTYSAEAGVTDATECTPCAVGTVDHDSNPATPCTDCPSGMYSLLVGATACVDQRVTFELSDDVSSSGSYLPFSDAPGLGPMDGAVDVAIGDVNGDGRPDLYAAKNGRNQLWLNSGSSEFTAVTQSNANMGPTMASGDYSLAVEIGDIDGDNRLDLFVANRAACNELLRNLESGFVSVRTGLGDYSCGNHQTTSARFGDMNRDGLVDIFVTNGPRAGYSGGSYNEVLIQQETELLSFAAIRVGGLTPSSSSAIFDADNDGDLDVYVTNGGNLGMALRGQNELWLNDECADNTAGCTPSFRVGFTEVSSTPTQSVAIADVNNDGLADIFTICWHNTATPVDDPLELLINQGSGEFVKSTSWYSTAWYEGFRQSFLGRSVESADVNSDGWPDLFVARSGQNMLLLNDKTGGFDVLGGMSSDSYRAAISDVNGDGAADIFLANGQDATVTLSINRMNTASMRHVSCHHRGCPNIIATQVQTYDVEFGDLNNDGEVDIVVANGSGEYGTTYPVPNEMMLNDRVGGFIVAPIVVHGSTYEEQSTEEVAIGDVNGDGWADIFFANWQGPNQLLINDQHGGFHESTLGSTGSKSTEAELRDVNGDGRLDLFVVNHAGSDFELYLGTGEAPNRELVPVLESSNLHQLTDSDNPNWRGRDAEFGDFNNDGRQDLIVCLSGGAQTRLHLSADQGFVSSWIGGIGTNSYACAIGDLDGDGDLDVYVGNKYVPNEVMLNQGQHSGIFTPDTSALAVETLWGEHATYDVHIGDVNGDGRVDLFVVNMNAQNALYFYSAESGTFTEQTGASDDLSSYSGALGDLNNDSLLDIFVGNHGQNSIAFARRCSDGDTWHNHRCYPCPVYSLGSTQDNRCSYCPGGTVGPPGTGGWTQDEAYACIPCAAGKYRAMEDAESECMDCPQGKFAVGGASECTDCAPGLVPSLQSPWELEVTERATMCVACPAGRGPAGTSCELCSVGQYSSTGQCADCAAGNEPNPSRTACESCTNRPGDSWYSSDGRECNQCADGYQPNSQRSACVECPRGSAGTGGTCSACGPGQQPTTGRTACQSCADVGDAFYSLTGVECIRCVAGEEPNENLNGCSNCIVKDDPFLYSPDGSPCIRCLPGQEPNAGRTACVACVEQFSSDGRQCVDCAPGYEPATNASACVACTGLDFSERGVCETCIPPAVVNADRTDCRVPYECPAGSTCGDPEGCGDETSGLPQCSSCPVGTISEAGGHCIACDGDGQRANDGQTACESCGAGTQPSNDRSSCVPCAELPGVAFSPFGITCQNCTGENTKVDDARTSCTACPPGTQPNQATKTGCMPCTGNQYSPFGFCRDCSFVVDPSHISCAPCSPGDGPVISTGPDGLNLTSCQACTGNSASSKGDCAPCPRGYAANAGKTRCEDVSQNGVSDVSILTGVLESSNLVPVTSLSSSVEDVDAVLEDGSDAQAAFVQDLTEHMALALGVDVASIKITGLRLAVDPAEQGGGRRTQIARAGDVTFDVEITGDDTVTALTTLSEQVSDPQSALRTAAGITSEAPSFTFACPIGMYRPVGAPECSYCSDTSVPDPTTSFQSCKECLPGQAPDPEAHSYCVCADNYYHSSGGRNLLKCYADGEPWSALMAPTVTDCLPCADTGCVDLGAIDCRGGNVILRPDFSVSQTSLRQGLRLNDMTGQRSIYACAVPGACLGDAGAEGLQCSAPYAGPLCDYCAEGYSRPGFTGECTECSEGLSTAWAALSAIVAVAAITLAMYWVASIDNSAVGRLTVMMTLGKIAVSLVQVLAQLDFSLQIIWPTSFRWLIDLLKVFSMDILGFVNIGCVSQYTYTAKFFFAVLLAPIMLLAVGLVYQLRKNVEGIVNRCVKMGLLTLFLIYPFVSQTIFQGFSCRQLDEEEEWLEVDYQISCLSDSYLAFVSLGMVGVIVYPVGIPTLTLLQLWRNAGAIKGGGAGRERYEFLVADYKPEFYYWDCLEMLRKAFITGILMFFKKGSLFQLVCAMIFCVAFLSSVAWLRPYASRTANVFKVGTEAALLVSLILVVLLKIDLAKEDVPGGETFVGFLLLLSNTVLPGSSLFVAILSFGFDLDETLKYGNSARTDSEFDNPVADNDDE